VLVCGGLCVMSLQLLLFPNFPMLRLTNYSIACKGVDKKSVTVKNISVVAESIL